MRIYGTGKAVYTETRTKGDQSDTFSGDEEKCQTQDVF